jgi:hypothetical protein
VRFGPHQGAAGGGPNVLRLGLRRVLRFVRLPAGSGHHRRVPQPITPPLHPHDFGPLQQPVEDRCRSRDIPQQGSLFLNGAIAPHQRQPIAVPTHDDLQQCFRSFGREALHAGVIQAQQVGLVLPDNLDSVRSVPPVNLLRI